MRWRIYYDDGSTRETLPATASQHLGVQAIVQCHVDNGKYYPLVGVDFYVLTGSVWIGMNDFGLIDHVTFIQEPIHCVLWGRAINKVDFKKIYYQAQEDARNALD